MGYIRTAKNEFGPCLFCDKSHIGKDEDNLVVHRGENAYILMNLYPYNNGHLMVVPYDHEKNFDDLQPDTQVEMMNLMSQALLIISAKHQNLIIQILRYLRKKKLIIISTN
jgi:ATP adenylyltransferase